MRGWLALFLALALLSPVQGAKKRKSSAADVAAGAKTFRSHCAECHGLNAEGGRGPNLAAGAYYHGSSDEELLTNISKGIPGTEMSGLFYSEDRVWQVVAFLRSLNKASRAEKGAGDPTSGAALYRAAGCAECHRIGGEGGRMGPDLTGIGLTRSSSHIRQAIVDPGADVRQRYWQVRLTGADGQSRKGFLMNEDTYTAQFMDLTGQIHSASKSELKNYEVEKTSAMPSYKDRFNAKELEDMVAYLSSLQPKRGDK